MKRVNGGEGYWITKEGKIFRETEKGKLRKVPTFIKGGVVDVGIVICEKRTTRPLSKLVAEHFLDNPHNLIMINHKDGNVKNNHVDNLEWKAFDEAGRKLTKKTATGTRCHIGYVVDNKAYYINVTREGYLSQTGELLLEYYDTLEKVKELVWLGDIEKLGKTIYSTVVHSYYQLENRDKKTIRVKNVYQLLEENSTNLDIEFTYLFFEDSEQWFVSKDFINDRDLEKGGLEFNLSNLTLKLIESEGE